MDGYFKTTLKGKLENLPADGAEMRESLQDPRFSAQVFFGIYQKRVTPQVEAPGQIEQPV